MGEILFLKKEILKCKLMCANCHRKIHRSIILLPKDLDNKLKILKEYCEG